MNTNDPALTLPHLHKRSIYKLITNTRRISLPSLEPSKPWPAAQSSTKLGDSKPREVLIPMPGVGNEGKETQPSAATLPPGEIPIVWSNGRHSSFSTLESTKMLNENQIYGTFKGQIIMLTWR